MAKGTSWGIVLLFIGFIFIPPVQWLLTQDAEIAVYEKRRLATLPSPGTTLESISSFPKRMEKYYSDHFGLRDQLIALHNLIYIKLFRKSPDTAVIIGRDNWLFYSADHSLQDFLGLRNIDVSQFETWYRVLRDRQEWLNDHGIKYLMAIVPSKMMIYPEYLPLRIQKKAGIPLMVKLQEYLEKSGYSGIVDLQQPLLKAKENQQVFFRTDTHWNTDGAYRAYVSIMEKIQLWYPNVTVIEEERRELQQVEFSGDLGVMLHLSHTLKELANNVEITDSCSLSVPRIRDDFVHPDKQLVNKSYYFPEENGCPDTVETALIIHDSFGRYMKGYFDESFKTVIYSQHVGFEDLKGFVLKIHPSVIIDQRASRYFSRMMKNDATIESYIMDKHFQESDDYRLVMDKDVKGEKFVSINDIVVPKNNDGILLKATGDDPFVELVFDHDPKPDCFLVQVSMTSLVETTMQLYYTTLTNNSFSPEMVVNKKIKKGLNELLFRLPHPDTRGRIRFDPGTTAGEYILHSLSIKGELYGR